GVDMTLKNTIGVILIISGIICSAVFTFADFVGLGSEAGFGYHQLTGTLAGLIVIGAGLLLKLKKA
ncbi:MAG: hypothetical protein JW928_01200, partial [Candidatus Aureabacteria bacterium]|nr:hypothetical protein [Candidatus Auribacterota bacterium]